MPQLIASPTPFASPSAQLTPYNHRSLQSPPASTGGSPSPFSVRLSCLSPNGRLVHTLTFRNNIACIESRRLPLAGTVENDIAERGDNDTTPDVIRTILPPRVRSALDSYPPTELLSVEVDTDAPTPRIGVLQLLSTLCLYTKKDVFFLRLGYIPSGAPDVEGQVLTVKEPFEQVLLGTSTSTNIVRIRQAPQRYSGHDIMCPPECVAMLTFDSSVSEYNLSLYHGKNDVTTPVSYSTEQIEDRMERITDFCFCKSSSLALLSSLTIAFLKGSGEVLLATPITFRGAVVSRTIVTKTIEYLDAELKESQLQSPRWRQYKVAKQFIMDAFPDNGRSGFLTVQTLSAVAEWPVQVQGPVLLPAESDDFETTALAVENFSADDLVGLAVGHAGNVIEFGILSPSAMIPRFQHESREDAYELNLLASKGALVCRVDLCDESDSQGPMQTAIGLVRDPVMDTVVHYITPSSIKSVYTNTVNLTANKAREQAIRGGSMFSPPSKRKDLKPRTTAWSCFDLSTELSSNVRVTGAVVSGDVCLGHTMVCALSTGSTVAINLTEARTLQEMEAISENQSQATPTKAASVSDRALRELQETQALTDIVERLIENTIKGLSHMRKIGGSATPTQAITPEVLAAVISVKERCEKEIVLPILEMQEEVNARRKDLEVMYEDQVSQLNALVGSIKKLQERQSQIEEKAEIVKTNASSLAQRSASVLQSSSDLLPTITQAEYDYFQEVSRLDKKVKEWQGELNRLNFESSSLLENAEGPPPVLSSDAIENAQKLQRGSKSVLQKQRQRLQQIENKVDDLATIIGIDRITLDQME